MRELTEYYEKWKKSLVKVAIVHWIVLSVLIVFLTNYLLVIPATTPMHTVWQGLLSFLLGCIGPSVTSLKLYSSLLNKANTKLWKNKFPNLNIDGEWEDSTTYSKQFDKNGYRTENDRKLPSAVIIHQTCTDIRIQPSHGKHFEWHSLAADWDSEGHLNILYRVNYSNELQKSNNYPESRTGFEQMSINRNGLLPNERPTELKGKFWHCIQDDGKPVYSGDVVYTRK